MSYDDRTNEYNAIGREVVDLGECITTLTLTLDRLQKRWRHAVKMRSMLAEMVWSQHRRTYPDRPEQPDVELVDRMRALPQT